MSKYSKMLRRLMVVLMAFAVVCVYSAAPMNQAYAASKSKKPTKITLNVKSKSLKVGQKFTAKVKTVKPKKASKAVVWKTSNKKIVTVTKKGVVRAIRPGKAYVTAVSKTNKKVKARIKVVVKQAVKETKPVVDLENTKARTMHVYVDMSKYDKGQEVKVWVPVPQSDDFQTIENVAFTAEKADKAEITTEKEFGNKMLYLEWGKDAEPADRTATLTFDAARAKVYRNNLKEDKYSRYTFSSEAKAYVGNGKYAVSEYVNPKDPVVKELASKIVGKEKTTLGKAKKIYDWIIAHFQRIDNGETVNGHKFEVQGCGFGNAVELIKAYNEVGVSGGHCTDINSTYVALCRAAGVPAREMFGIRLNDNASGGQHCWAEFYLPGTGWVYADPADVLKEARSYTDKGMSIDEARKQESVLAKATELWGGVDNNRIVLSTGRDITFEPAQSWGACNTFGYPAAEVGGKRLEDFTKAGDFKYTITCTGIGVPDYVYLSADEWAKYGINVEDLRTTDYLVDVRPDAQREQKGFVPGADICPVSNPYTAEQKAAIKEVYDKAQAEGKRVVLVCVSGNMLAKNAMAALASSGVDMSKVTYLIGGFNNGWSPNLAVVAPDKKSVSVPAWVTNGKGPDGKLLMLKTDGQLDPAKADLTHHVLVNENGGNASAALLNTKTLPIHVYTALQAIGGTPYDKFNKADAFEEDGKTAKTGAMLGEDAQKINVSFVSGDNTYGMADFFDHVVTPTSEIVSSDAVEVEPYVADMRFGGCIENVMAEQYINSPAGNQTGCITCTFSCWIGTVSNGEYGYNTQESKVNRANVPAANTPVTVVYTLGE